MDTRTSLAALAMLAATTVAVALGRQSEMRPGEVATAFVEAYNAHDATRLGALYADNVTVTAPDTIQTVGRAEQEKYFRAWFRSVPEVAVTVTTLTTDEDRFVLELRERGVYRRRMPTAGSPRARGQKLAYPWVLIARVVDGQIVSARFYENDQLVEKQLRGS